MRYCIYCLIILISGVLLFPFNEIHAEGTKELEPAASDYCKIRLNEGGTFNNFAIYNCAPTERLWFRIQNPGEKVYLGFGEIDGTVECRIKNSAEVLAWGPINLPESAAEAGYIENWTQAFNGPDVLSTSGYSSISFVPPATGDYFIEFNLIGSPSDRELNQFDLTIIDTTITPLSAIQGRLWSEF